jgi:hypothetical protein
VAEFVGGVPSGSSLHAARVSTSLASPPPPHVALDRKLIRNTVIDLVVTNPADQVEKIRLLAEQLGGFLVKSETSGTKDSTTASITLRVPASHYGELRDHIRKLGQVDNERLAAEDASEQYVDQKARLRNLQAQEEQYLAILKQARTVKDTLEVSDKLNEVREQIEKQRAEFEMLSKQVETVEITVSLHTESAEQSFGIHWRPSIELKLAAMQGLEGLADYATAMLGFAFYLPAILLWFTSIVLGAALTWKALRWGARAFFGWRRPSVAAPQNQLS